MQTFLVLVGAVAAAGLVALGVRKLIEMSAKVTDDESKIDEHQ